VRFERFWHEDQFDDCFSSPISSLKARAVLIDMEESVVEASQRSSIGELFDPALSVTSQSGSGNNWAVGFYEYGSQYRPGKHVNYFLKLIHHCRFKVI